VVAALSESCGSHRSGSDPILAAEMFTRFFVKISTLFPCGNGTVAWLTVIRRPLSTKRGHPTTPPTPQAQPLSPSAPRSCALRSLPFVSFESFLASPNLKLASLSHLREATEALVFVTHGAPPECSA